MNKPVNVTVGYNPDYHGPKAPELVFEIGLAGAVTPPGDVERGAQRHRRPVVVLKQAVYAREDGLASVLVWKAARVLLPRQSHNVSVAGLESWHDLTRTVGQAQALALRLDEVFENGSVVADDEITVAILDSIIMASHTVKVEAPEFLAVAELPAGDIDADQVRAFLNKSVHSSWERIMDKGRSLSDLLKDLGPLRATRDPFAALHVAAAQRAATLQKDPPAETAGDRACTNSQSCEECPVSPLCEMVRIGVLLIGI